MYHRFLVLAALGFWLGACQAGRPLSPTGIYRTAANFRQQLPALPGTHAGRVFLARKAFVTHAPGSPNRRTQVDLDSIWGYAGADHRAYRFAAHRAYRVEQTDTLMLYSHLAGSGRQQHLAYCFSAGLSGAVHPLSSKWLLRTYPDNLAFLQALRQAKWYHSLSAHSQPPQSFWVVALYRQSLGLPASYPKRPAP